MIFGTDSRPVRFDMSEFAQEHSRERLIGAPPGYVGHSAGGELTNAVRANPMSVLLFDEIDKADPRLYDLFLQILEDGRLTDGRGATVYFTECVLIFTSNLGVVARQPDGTERRLSREDAPEAVQKALRLAFDDFFDRKIGRPELRNRFGDSFIAMDFIQPDSVPAILGKALRSVTDRVAEVHGARLQVADAALDTLRLASITALGHGGRGVNNTVEAALVNPLATELFGAAPEQGESIVVDAIEPDGDLWRIKVSRCSG
jgi:ATP-dependent Clp protease ATP-binding subunit ClpA